MATGGPATIPIRPVRRRFDLARLGLEWQRIQYQLHLQVQWWIRPQAPYQPVFVLASHRSGSNLLIDYLNRLPGVQSHSEILCRVFPNGPSKRQAGRRWTVRHIRRSLHLLTAPTRGCKLMLDQLVMSHLKLDELQAAFSNAKYIVLYRESLAEQFVSKETAFATNQWTLSTGEQRKQARVYVNPARLRAYCESLQQSYRDVLGHSWLRERAVLLSYEQLTADPRQRLRNEICPLLGVPPAEPESILIKQNTQPLAQRVQNYHEVAALLNGPLCHQHYTWPGQHRAQRRAA